MFGNLTTNIYQISYSNSSIYGTIRCLEFTLLSRLVMHPKTIRAIRVRIIHLYCKTFHNILFTGFCFFSKSSSNFNGLGNRDSIRSRQRIRIRVFAKDFCKITTGYFIKRSTTLRSIRCQFSGINQDGITNAQRFLYFLQRSPLNTSFCFKTIKELDCVSRIYCIRHPETCFTFKIIISNKRNTHYNTFHKVIMLIRSSNKRFGISYRNGIGCPYFRSFTNINNNSTDCAI